MDRGVYAILAISFRSHIQPLIVISAVPFGVLFSTVIPLVIVPTGYLILDDCKRFAGGWWAPAIRPRTPMNGSSSRSATAPEPTMKQPR